MFKKLLFISFLGIILTGCFLRNTSSKNVLINPTAEQENAFISDYIDLWYQDSPLVGQALADIISRSPESRSGYIATGINMCEQDLGSEEYVNRAIAAIDNPNDERIPSLYITENSLRHLHSSAITNFCPEHLD